VDAALNKYGRLDGAFNNAGLSQTNVMLHEMTAEGWRLMDRRRFTGRANPVVSFHVE
jgi:NAD(P)-dependent dehydrogenase (short-subunit alcohol dehydrogenase family)